MCYATATAFASWLQEFFRESRAGHVLRESAENILLKKCELVQKTGGLRCPE
ncbi:MAG: hypothetical protein UX02_C0003G0067 [Candidatus Moranbacteria bacterium GW2011_GWC1_45_18]|nr:MAG: hypothetical protein UT79_C0004G0067 [Candidatus Moranbacteria bacterium GW2011_GWC2_40_12]KKT33679.1 MAG: hypothetical protein UW19_C0007G0070 [Candidatus Moranbacteria bacterium GW2011_GWF2_44_10]KKT70126.1 MAG: hypothetical protein UW66_C0051G0007 [Candidatus Moranbacteria bacterium GW2011_GWF1_44_4]KKT99524.1 MAG: hypothetical protein UX02_C0003G0067 [Candidatus Moranbacteria bacterium GW2011_GWC1_45_18]